MDLGSGTFWEEHCDAHDREVGFEAIPTWPSCYFHKKCRLVLIIYVDEFKPSGPKVYLRDGWDLIRLGVAIDPPSNLGLFLGCLHQKDLIILPDGLHTVFFHSEKIHILFQETKL